MTVLGDCGCTGQASCSAAQPVLLLNTRINYFAMLLPIVLTTIVTIPMPSAQMPRCTQLYLRSMIRETCQS